MSDESQPVVLKQNGFESRGKPLQVVFISASTNQVFDTNDETKTSKKIIFLKIFMIYCDHGGGIQNSSFRSKLNLNVREDV